MRTKHRAKLRGYRGHVNRIMRAGQVPLAAAYAVKHDAMTPELRAAITAAGLQVPLTPRELAEASSTFIRPALPESALHAARDADANPGTSGDIASQSQREPRNAGTGGEGVARSPRVGIANTSVPSGDFSQWGSSGEGSEGLGIGGGSLARGDRDQDMVSAARQAMVIQAKAGVDSPYGSGQSGGVGAGAEVVKKIEEFERERKSGNVTGVVTMKVGRGGALVRESSISLNKRLETALDVEIRERKERAMKNPWPEECVARVVGRVGNKWQMEVELPDGRKAPVWKAGFNLYVQERVRVAIEERLGEDVIYRIVERLADEEKNVRTTDGMTALPVGFEGQTMRQPVEGAPTIPEPRLDNPTAEELNATQKATAEADLT